MENKDLKWIKKHYSEKLAHICRELFPTILETEGVLPRLLSENFAQNKNLGKDLEENNKLIEFKSLIYFLFNTRKEKNIEKNIDPKDLMEQAGYILYPECKTEKDIQSFRHYYYRGEKTPQYIEGQTPERWKGEELCTFNGDRLNSCRVWFAVKKEVVENENAIKRSEQPSRQDDYGTSVLSIQFSKGGMQTLSIKNRYNHSVLNPDATFSNNLDNIIEGLTNAFVNTYNIDTNNIDDIFEMDSYIRANDGKYYRYNYEINNVYYCENNTIIDNFKVKNLDSKYLLMDYYIIDMQEKKIFLYDQSIEDCFCDTLGNIKNINITKDENKDTLIQVKVENGEDVLITLNQQRQIIKLCNQNLKECGNRFLYKNNSLIEASLPNLKKCGYFFLYNNSSLTDLSMPKLEKCGHKFMYKNNLMTELFLPNLKECGNYFMYLNKKLTDISLPNLQSAGDYFMYFNKKLINLSLPNLQNVGDNFFYFNNSLTKLSLPNLQSTGDNFFYFNKSLIELSLPNLQNVGDYFMYFNNSLIDLTLPNLQNTGDEFLSYNNIINEVSLPNLKECGNNFMVNNESLIELSLPKLEECGSFFIADNTSIADLTLPSLKKCQNGFMGGNNSLSKLLLPKFEECGNHFMCFNKSITELSLPKLQRCGNNFMEENNSLTKVSLPNLEECGNNFMCNNNSITELSLPKLQLKYLFDNKRLKELLTKPNIDNKEFEDLK